MKQKISKTDKLSREKQIILNTDSEKNDHGYWLLAVAVLLSLIAYIPAFSANFVNWDDQDYAINNVLIKGFSPWTKFFTTTVQGNYHPLTMFSLAINHAISGEHAFSFHLFNIILHLANVILVYIFIQKLTSGNTFIAFTVALIFGVHPMHVESVAWVSERKDVLYSFFFLLGLISYLSFIDKQQKKYLIYTLIWFILSLASKPSAIIFPVVLFLLDFFRGRPLNFKLVIEKLPFFILSAILVFLTMHQQEAVGATPLTKIYEFERRMFFPFYGFMMYLFKFIWPLKLTAFYPFPPINEASTKPYLFSPIIFILVAFLCFKTWKTYKEISFGFAFYFINLLLVLQFFMFGSAIIAERYTYIPYIGLAFVAAWLIDQYFKIVSKTAYSLVLGIGLIFTFLSFKQSASWQNTGALWDSAIKNYPSAKAYANRAYVFQQESNFEKAIENYIKSAKLNVNDKSVYYNLGVIYFNQNKDSLALVNYNLAIELKPDYIDALNGRGSLYARQGKSELALADFNKIKEINPSYDLATKNKASAFFADKKFDEAIQAYKEYLLSQKNDAEAYAYLGTSYLNKGMNEEAIKAYEAALAIKPDFLGAYTNLGAAYMNLNQINKALENLNKAFALDSTNEDNLKFLSKAYLTVGDTSKALSLFEMSNRIQERKIQK